MDALTLDDLLPLEEFAGRRREFFDSHRRYLDRYRRVRIGPKATLVFENRQTLWFRVQDLLRIARLAEPARVQQELDLYNRLLPRRNRLQAALLLTLDESKFTEEIIPWRDLLGEQVTLFIGSGRYPANLLTCRPEDHCIGAAHSVQFVLDGDGRRCLGDPQQPAHFSVTVPGYVHDSGPLGEEIRGSLLEDLALSDRDP